MSKFVPHDPKEFDAVYVWHEAGHLLLAYYYGFRIGEFRIKEQGGQRGASIFVGLDRLLLNETLSKVHEIRIRQLLAGELAARIASGSATDQIVFGSEFALRMDSSMALSRIEAEIHRIDPPLKYDISKIFSNIVIRSPSGDWWNWIWGQHTQVKNFLLRHWDLVEQLVAEIEAAAQLSLHVGGKDLFAICRRLKLPIADKAKAPVADSIIQRFVTRVRWWTSNGHKRLLTNLR